MMKNTFSSLYKIKKDKLHEQISWKLERNNFNFLSQMISLLIGITYFGQHIDLDGVMNINGALFIFLNCMTFQNVFAVINVR